MGEFVTLENIGVCMTRAKGANIGTSDMSSHVEQIKERLGIVDVVSSYLKLDKAGVNFRARCPFHNEKTPSFFVSPSRNTFYCFGCGVKGDIFSFVEQFEGTDFKGALQTLADRAGVRLAPVDKRAEDKKARLYRVLECAAVFFEKTYAKTKAAQAYVKQRGIHAATATQWRIGYAPASWDTLLLALTAEGFSTRDLLDAGLIKPSPKGTGKHYDRFRGRIIFPIMDSSGRVVAYTGRILPDKRNPEYRDNTAKYLNSPETTLYEKSRILYGFHLAKQAIRKYDFSILVEGQMDVVLSAQAGYPNTVAVSGTALTEHQVAFLDRLSHNIVMAFDADAAGLAAGGKGIDLALARGMDVKVAALPAGKDPADLATEGKDVWKKVIRGAKHVIDFYLDHLEEKYTDARKRRLMVGKTVIPYIAQIPNKLDQAHFVETVAARLGLSEAPLWEAVRAVAPGVPLRTAGEGRGVPVPNPTEEPLRLDTILERLFGIMRWQEGLSKEDRIVDLSAVETRIRNVVGKQAYAELQKTYTTIPDEVIFSLERMYAKRDDVAEDIEETLHAFEREELRRKYTAALDTLKRAEARGKKQEIQKALETCRALSAKLNK